MNFETVRNELEKVLPKHVIKYNEPMKKHTSFRVGGPVDILVTPTITEEVVSAIEFCKKYNIPYFVMGNGSNLIVRDGGYRGLIIKLAKFNKITVEGSTLIAESGALLSATAGEALKHSLKGMEFASGIPGTVGGAVAMNAGAYGPEIKDIIDYAVVLDMDCNIFKLNRDELNLSYRNSIVQQKNYLVLEAAFTLEKGEYEAIKARMDELNRRRADKQPLNYPSAGSTFKRPEGNFASKLIDDSGLKGLSVGGAMVSEKHAGFIINYDNATAKDVLELIKKVQQVVKEKFNVLLEPEVKIIGED
ncbi:UDP-N-acetylmuramate dehydrogenase [Fonticella tunisiensis]|uniref:UDP-N-acetylenolpyruvoylglucosamine reductase n=1 Tax=Fonticella tunisiensis TaxID=1096341 RepID=A0A4R7KU92_9CLOT|nr:UDP-N-acetylmuramate dehydrogenase [Fonticella tunisiensis]TDT63727.1 UDP-N-acetylmuramate dehydrogenase [Fonticella tunisiensis]